MYSGGLTNDNVRVMAPWKPITFICFGLCILGIIASVIVISLITLYLSPKGADIKRNANSTSNGATNTVDMVFATDTKGATDYSVTGTNSMSQQLNQQMDSKSYGVGVDSASFSSSTDTDTTESRRKKRQLRAPMSCDTETASSDGTTANGDKLIVSGYLNKTMTPRCPNGYCDKTKLAAILSAIASKLASKPFTLNVEVFNGYTKSIITVTVLFCKFGSVLSRALSPRRIDTHYHIVPDFYAKALSDAGGDPSGGPSPTWSVEQSLDHMNQLGIETAMVTVTAPGTKIYENENDTSNIKKGRDLARQINKFQETMVDNNTLRFGSFAQLPALTDVEGVLEEIAYVESTGKHNGYILFTSYGEEYYYLGNDLFEPIWAKFDELKSVVFIHPSHAPIPTANKYIIQPLIDYPQETTRTATDIVVSGMRAKYPNPTVFLSHAGGTLPYLAFRISMAGLITNPSPPRNQPQILADFKTFHYDTAISSSSPQLKALLDFIGPAQITFGSDDCYVPLPAAIAITKGLDDYFLTNPITKDIVAWKAIVRGNAKRVFPNKVID